MWVSGEEPRVEFHLGIQPVLAVLFQYRAGTQCGHREQGGGDDSGPDRGYPAAPSIPLPLDSHLCSQWHQNALHETEQSYSKGKAFFSDWSNAKALIRANISVQCKSESLILQSAICNQVSFL